MSNMPSFPAFIRLEHQPNGSAKQSFLAEVVALAGDTKRQFDEAYSEVGKMLSRSVSSLRAGKIGFDIDVSGLRQAAAQADHTVARLNLLRDAAIQLADKTGDTSSQTKLYIDALRAQVTEAERAKEIADAQVSTYSRLQGQIDKNVNSNQELADSYRALYAEQARAENASFAAQQMFNKLAALGLANQPKSAAESASVFESQSYAPKADISSDLDRFLAGSASLDKAAVSATTLEQVLGRVARRGADITAAMQAAAKATEDASQAATKVPSSTPVSGKWGAEALVAGQATLDRAAVSGTTLEQVLGRVANKGKEVGAALEQAAQASANAIELEARALKLAEAEMKRYADQANNLLQRLDPALALQQRFDQELEKAQRLFAAGAISMETYAAAQALARQELQQGWAAITAGTNEVANAAKRGTTAHQSMINSVASSRQAYTMLGQQMQDVVVQAQMGTNGLIIFTQQVPQAAFALSGLAESANKTERRIGQFASYLSGPYGAAIFGAIAIGGPLIANLLDIGEEAEKTKGKVYEFSGSFDVLTLKVGQSVEAMDQLSAAAKAAIEVNGDLLKSLGLVADASVAALEKRIGETEEKLSKFKRNSDSWGAVLAPGILGPSVNDMKEARKLSESLAEDQAALEKAKTAQTNSEIAESERRAISAVDKHAAALYKYKEAVGELNDAYKRSKDDPVGATQDGTFINQAEYEKRRLAIEKEKKASLDALKKQPKASNALANFGERTDETIKRISDKFSEQPKLISEAMTAVRQLDTMIAKLEKRKPSGWADMVQDAKAAKQEITDFFGRQAEQIERNSQRNVALQQLTASGHEAEAQALQYIWQLEDRIGTEQQIRNQIQSYINQGRASEAKALQSLLNANIEMKQRVIEIAQEEQKHLDVLKRKQLVINAFSSALQSTRSEVESIMGGLADPSKIRGNFENIIKRLRGQFLTESIFGDVFKDMDKYVRRHSGIDSSVEQLIEGNNRVSQSAATLADALDTAAGRIKGTPANDNRPLNDASDAAFGRSDAQRIAGALPAAPTTDATGVNAQANGDGIRVQGADLTLEKWVEKLTEGMAKKVLNPIDQKLGTKFFGQFSAVLGAAMAGNLLTGGSKWGTAIGALSKLDTLPKEITKGMDGLLSSTGLSTSNISKAFGTALSGLETSNKVTGLASAVGIKLDNTGSSIGGALGALSGIPGGDIIGSIAGGIIGNLFKVSERGTVVIGAGKTSVTGSTSATTNGLAQAGNTVQDQLSSIASSLSTTVGDFSVSIGRYKDYYRVSASGSDRVGDKYYPNSAGADILYDGTELEEAVAIAVKNAIMDGAVKGISQTSKNILAAGSDISSALSKVQAIESIPKRIKAFTDPVGAALDDLNGQFSVLVSYLKEGSAKTEQYAQAQQLYELERAAAIKQATQQVTGSLQSLYDSLTSGNDARSLTERKATALAAYQPLAARVAAGDTTAFEEFSSAAQTLVDIERQMSGSQSDYFALLDQVTKLTKTAIDAQTDKITAATNSTTDSPFSGISTTTASDNAAVTAALSNLNLDLNSQLSAVNDNLGSLLGAINALKSNGYSTGTTGTW